MSQPHNAIMIAGTTRFAYSQNIINWINAIPRWSNQMYESQILRALQNAVTAAVQASTLPALPIAYVDVNFIKPNDQKWLEVVHIPNNDNSAFIGQEKNYMGLLRLVLHWPNTGSGAYTRLDLLGSIADYFQKGLLFDGVQIVQAADYVGASREGDEVIYPLSIRYCSYRP